MAITRTASLCGKKFCQPPGRPPCPCVQYMTFIIPCSPFSFCVFRSSAFAFQPPPGPRLRLRFLSILACISLSSPLPFLPPGHTLHVRCLWCPWVLALAPLSFLLLDLLRVLVFNSLRRSSFGLVFHHSCFWGSPPSPFSSLLQFLPFVSVLALSHPRSRLVLRFLFLPWCYLLLSLSLLLVGLPLVPVSVPSSWILHQFLFFRFTFWGFESCSFAFLFLAVPSYWLSFLLSGVFLFPPLSSVFIPSLLLASVFFPPTGLSHRSCCSSFPASPWPVRFLPHLGPPPFVSVFPFSPMVSPSLQFSLWHLLQSSARTPKPNAGHGACPYHNASPPRHPDPVKMAAKLAVNFVLEQCFIVLGTWTQRACA